MKFDMVVSGVGGQGILSISFVVDNAALEEGHHFKQSEVHGMAQRGGAVMSHLRISDSTIYSDLVPFGGADLILSMEPLETLRYFPYLSAEGSLVASCSPFVNIPNYPELDGVLDKIQTIEKHTVVNAEKLARAAGSHFAQNIVMLGAARHLIPMESKTLEKYIGVLFKAKGEKIIDVNLKAFRYGSLSGELYRKAIAAGMDPLAARGIITNIDPENVSDSDMEFWLKISLKPGCASFIGWLNSRPGLLAADEKTYKTLEKIDFEAENPDFDSELM